MDIKQEQKIIFSIYDNDKRVRSFNTQAEAEMYISDCSKEVIAKKAVEKSE